MSWRANRREFLKSSALAGVGFWVAGSSAAGQSRSPNEKLNIGIIGVAQPRERPTWRSCRRARTSPRSATWMSTTWPRRPRSIPKAKTYIDWRKLLDQKDLDAVVVSTTEHTHALASVMAMKRGKHVYCEKPLAHSVYEARVMRETYKQTKVATQMGTQIHATDNYRRVVELIQSGAIGPVREAHVWVDQGIEGPRSRPHGDAAGSPEPALGPLAGPGAGATLPLLLLRATVRMSWQNWWDFGNGALGDMGSHIIDLPFWALELQYPTTVEAEGPLPVRAETYPDWLTVRWEHPARGDRPPVKLTWYDGNQRPKSPEGVDLQKWHLGDHVRRRQGNPRWPTTASGSCCRKPTSRTSSRPSLRSPRRSAITRNGSTPARPARRRSATSTTPARWSSTICWARSPSASGKKLEWDPENLKARNCPEADRFIRPPYREGWTL